jgi:hypothetical protein
MSLRKIATSPLGGLALIGEGCFLSVTFPCSLPKESNSPTAKAFEGKTSHPDIPARGGAAHVTRTRILSRRDYFQPFKEKLLANGEAFDVEE